MGILSRLASGWPSAALSSNRQYSALPRLLCLAIRRALRGCRHTSGKARSGRHRQPDGRQARPGQGEYEPASACVNRRPTEHAPKKARAFSALGREHDRVHAGDHVVIHAAAWPVVAPVRLTERRARRLTPHLLLSRRRNRPDARSEVEADALQVFQVHYVTMRPRRFSDASAFLALDVLYVAILVLLLIGRQAHWLGLDRIHNPIGGIIPLGVPW